MPIRTYDRSHARPNEWFVTHDASPSPSLRLFCFPHAGGGASFFIPWRQELSANTGLSVAMLPGRESRFDEPARTSVSHLVESLVAAMSPLLDRPYSFFGHSLGALLAFEIVRVLRRQRRRLPLCLFVSGHRAAHLPMQREPIYHLPDERFVKRLLELKGTPESVLDNEELMQLFLPLLRADFTASETYQYQAEEPLPCPISALAATHDDEATVAEVAAWSELTTSSFQFTEYEGDHFYLAHERAEVIRQVTSELNQIATR